MKLIIFVSLIAMAAADVNTLLKESNDQFTAKMFNEVAKSNPDKSIILSAFSVLSPLAQLALASVGESHDELLKTIGLPNDNVTKQVFEGVNARLRAVKGVDLKMANRMYIAKDAELNPNFAALSQTVFNSDVKNVDFEESEKTAQEVNAWVEEQTNNKIKDLVNPTSLTSLTRALLVNAIYFKGTWKIPFNKKSTAPADFHVNKDKTVQVPTMHSTATYRYAESSELDAKILELPYEGEESSFVIVLPNKVDGIKELAEKLKDPAALNTATDKLVSTEVIVSLPKFKIETTTNLKEILLKLQVTKVFDSSTARLDNLLNKESNLYVSDAIQKAFIEVNEEGAEAAAANELPYEGEESSFVIVLPNKVDGIKELAEKLKDPAALNTATDKLVSTEVIVSLPKFKIETTTNLKEILLKLQVTKVFDSSTARLDNLLNKESNLYVSDAIQKAFIEVNEEGAEAAAANEFNISYLSAYVPDKRDFTADHPFVFYLTEEDNVLFSGVYQS